MSRFASLLAVATALCIMAPAGAALAQNQKVYTINTQPIPLRSWPSQRAKILAMVPPSSTVEFAKKLTHSLVVYQGPDGKTEQGWILSKFLSAVPSNSTQVKELSTENEALKAQLAQLENDNSGLTQKEKELKDKLDALNSAYLKLKNGSADYLKLKAEYKSAKIGLDRARKTMQRLTRQNENLTVYHNIQWFLAGGLVLLLGWLLGWGSTKWRRKRKQSYYL